MVLIKLLKTSLPLLFTFIFCSDSFAQTHFIVKLNDKDAQTINSKSASNFLSEKAIARRTNQNIAFTSTDIPISKTYLVKLKDQGFKILTKSKWLNTVVLESSEDVDANLKILNSLSFVSDVSASEIKTVQKPHDEYNFKGDKIVSVQSQASNQKTQGTYNYGLGNRQIKMINGHSLHNAGFLGEGIVIALLDAGYKKTDVYPAFKKIRNNGQILGTWDFVMNNNNVYDDDQHGTMVLSTIAAYIPGSLIGTAPNAKFWLLRSEDATAEYIAEEYFWAEAAEFADSVGADIINSSLGYTKFDNPGEDHTYNDLDGNTTPITIAADMAASKGILVVNSAGNEGDGTWNFISAPSDGDLVLSVGAVDSTRQFATFSGNGPTADGRIKPNVAAQGELSAIASPWDSIIVRGNGTSFSSPIIAGMAACLWQVKPELTNLQIKSAIEASAHLHAFPNNDMGHGIPDFQLAYATITNTDPDVFQGKSKIFNLFPNPVDDEFQVMFFSDRDDTYQVQIVNALGQIIMEESKSFGSGINAFNMNTSSLANGYYQIVIGRGSDQEAYPFIKQELK